jgi:AraC family transcriptional regulator
MKTMKSDTRADYSKRVLRVLLHIQNHLSSPLPLTDLAGLASFSPFHFHRIFRGMVGESLKQHIRRLRLERAAVQLKTTAHPVITIAFNAGYESHEAFTSAFRSAFHCTPSQYRTQRSMAAQLAAPTAVHFGDGQTERLFQSIQQEPCTMKVEVRELPPLRVAFLRHVGPYDQVGSTWERLTDWAGMNCLMDGSTQLFGACHDDPDVTQPDKIRYDACITVADHVTAEDNIGIQEMSGGRYAVTLHEGPFDQLGETYANLFGSWFAGSSLEPGPPPCLEFYLTDPESTEPEDLLTELWVPLQSTPGHHSSPR